MSAMGIGLVIFIAGFTTLGLGMFFLIKGSGKRYVIAGKSLPFILVGSMLTAQSIDANATIGNASLAYVGGFWAGFVLPLGLASCLLLTGLFFAKPLNSMNLLTLPDFYSRRYGASTEVLASIMMSISFIILVAGNFAGGAWILSIVFDMNYLTALITIAVLVTGYTVAGGLFSCAATDIVQIYPSIIGFVGCLIFLIAKYGWDFFAGSIPDNFLDISGLTQASNGALINWAGFLALALGDIVALDFMERIFSAKSPEVAQKSCFFGAGLTVITGISCTFIGLMGLKLYPGLADPRMVLPNLALYGIPFIFGLFILGGILAAGASTADGGILGVSTVLGRNILQKNILRRRALKKAGVQKIAGNKVLSDRHLLLASRIMTIPVVSLAIWLAYVKPEPGILLILAFDVVFAGCLVPLVLGIYWKKSNAAGALTAILVGSTLRMILFYTIPEPLAGLDTLIPPVVSLVSFVVVSLMTQEKYPPKHEVIDHIPTDDEVLVDLY
jgi:SSS family solute:Na+ symporter